VFRVDDELFSPLSWTQVFDGQGLQPERFDPLMAGIPIDLIEGQLRQVREFVAGGVASMPDHASFIRQCAGASDLGAAPVTTSR
jgi:tryptophan 7-halogenase